MAGNDQTLIDGVRRLSPPIYPMIYPKTRGEVVQHYQQTYGNDWKSHITTDLEKQTGRSRKTVAREFQMDKRTGKPRYEGKVTKATAAKYETLGKTLKPTPDTSKPPKYKYPPGGMTITFVGQLKISRKWKPIGGNYQFSVHADSNSLGFGDFKTGADHAANFLARPNGWDIIYTYFIGWEAGDVEDYEGVFTVS